VRSPDEVRLVTVMVMFVINASAHPSIRFFHVSLLPHRQHRDVTNS
jgi:hypothetical protein